MPAPLLSLLEDHAHIARLLVLLQRQSETLRRGGRAEFATLRPILDYLTQHVDRHHVPREELVLARVEARNPRIAEIAAEMRRGHEMLARREQQLLARVRGTAAPPKHRQGLRLWQMLAEYVVLLRRHMHYEETIVFEEALRVLRRADWQHVADAQPALADPIFGASPAPQYEELRSRYLNRATAVATGQVPIGLFEVAGSTAERLAASGRQLRRLPGALWQHGRARTRQQQRMLGALLCSRDVDSLREALQSLGKAQLAGPAEYFALIRRALLGAGDLAGGAPGSPVPGGAVSSLAVVERMFHPSNAAGVSWQAATLNLLLRTTMKPLFSTLDARRAHQFGKAVARWQRPPPNVRLTPVEGQSFRADWIRPIGLHPTGRRTILYLPGGGFFLPATTMHVEMLARLARMTKARPLLVHYRLAPDHPFPAGLDDALAAYEHLLRSGTSPAEIVVAGDSAGGGLTLSLLLALRQRGLAMPAGGAMLSALSDLKFSAPSRTYNRWRDPMLPTGTVAGAFFDSYAPDMARDDPLVSPIYGDYHGFPPMFAQVGSSEILIDDTLLIARKARMQGAEFEVEVWEGMPHVWQVAGFLPESRQALLRLGAFFVKAWFRAEHAGRGGGRPVDRPGRRHIGIVGNHD